MIRPGHVTPAASDSYSEIRQSTKTTTDRIDRIVPVAIVPARLIQAILRHEIKPTDKLYQKQGNQLRQIDSKEPARDFRNNITGQELELLIAAFSRLDNDSSVSEFRSEAEWIELASGKPARSAPEYHKAIRALETPRWTLDKIAGRLIVDHKHPVTITERYDLTAPQRPRKVLAVTLSEPMTRNRRSFFQIPLGLSAILRGGGLRKVATSHLRLYLYVLARVRSKTSQRSILIENMIRAAGLYQHLVNGQANRAMKVIRDGLNAMVGAHILDEWEFLPGNRIGLIPSKAHFRIRNSASNLSKRKTNVARGNVAICK